MERRPVIAPKQWTCPICSDIWEVHPLEPLNPARRYYFGTGEWSTNAEWVRLRRS